MPRGGFKSVDLNVVGWIVLLAPGTAVGVVIAAVTGLPLLPVVAAGVAVAFVLGRVLDDLRDRRQLPWVPVVALQEARDRLRAAGIPCFGTTAAEVDGRRVE